MNSAALINQAMGLHQQGRLDEAEALYKRVLVPDPNNFDALQLLGLVNAQRGSFVEAEKFLRKALSIDAKVAPCFHNYGTVLCMLKRFDEGIKSYASAIKLAPNHAPLYSDRGNALYELKRYDEALADYDKALALKSDLSDSWLGRGNVFLSRKLYDKASTAFDNALKFNPRLANAWVGLGAIRFEQNRYQEAGAAYDKALALNSGLAQAWLGRGNVLFKFKRHDDALAAFNKALALKPDLAEAILGQGNVHADSKRYDEALAAYDRALALNSELLEAWSGRSLSYRATGRFAEALDSFENQLRSATPKAHPNFENIINLGKAIFSLDCLPAAYENESQITASRVLLNETMTAINAELDSIDGELPSSILDAIFLTSGFFISYQQDNDRDLMRSYSQILGRILRPGATSSTPKPRPADKIRVGIASEFLKDHSAARYAYEWLSHLPAADYEFFAYALHGDSDAITKKFESLGSFRRLAFDPSSYRHAIDAIKADNLHFLMLPDVGMTATSRIMSQHRIAPVQFTSWGHPVTTGSPAIDFFVSSELMEIPGGGDHYTEKLIRLPNTSRYIEPAPAHAGGAAFDLPENRILYGCLQSLFKLLPQFDVVFPQIAKRVPGACFVFIEGDPAYMTQIVKRRLTRAFEQNGLRADDYVRFLPRMDSKRYVDLCHAIDISIDSIGWSGGYTTIECLEAGRPTVTLPTPYMRGRHSYAALKQMGMDELIATSMDDFVDKLSRLGADVEWRHTVMKKLSENRAKIYRDRSVIDAFDAFLKTEFAKLSG